MDAATIGVLGGMITMMMTIMLSVMIYLDRARRADMVAGFAAVDGRFDRFEERVNRRFDRVDERFDEFTGIVVDLAKEVGEVKGRLAVSTAVEAFSRVD